MRDYLKFCYSLVYMALLILGIGGVFYTIFMEDGVLEKIGGKIIDFELRYPVMMIPTVLGALVAIYMWHSGQINPTGKVGIWGGIVNFLFLGAGAYFAVVLARRMFF